MDGRLRMIVGTGRRADIGPVFRLCIPAEPINENGRVDFEPFCQSQQARQAQVALAPFDLRDEGEVQAHPIGDSHLAKAEFGSSFPYSRAQLRLRRVPLLGPSHPGQSKTRHVPRTSGPGISGPGISGPEPIVVPCGDLLTSGERSASEASRSHAYRSTPCPIDGEGRVE